MKKVGFPVFKEWQKAVTIKATATATNSKERKIEL